MTTTSRARIRAPRSVVRRQGWPSLQAHDPRVLVDPAAARDEVLGEGQQVLPGVELGLVRDPDRARDRERQIRLRRERGVQTGRRGRLAPRPAPRPATPRSRRRCTPGPAPDRSRRPARRRPRRPGPPRRPGTPRTAAPPPRRARRGCPGRRGPAGRRAWPWCGRSRPPASRSASISATWRPARASSQAVQMPAMPPPTTATSTSGTVCPGPGSRARIRGARGRLHPVRRGREPGGKTRHRTAPLPPCRRSSEPSSAPGRPPTHPAAPTGPDRAGFGRCG